ncbi:MAG TPA: hypothetical protein VK492_11460, partial [Chitinophagaceae bacterium]|nr:hypothetical protein [Chitinophagaceae bacterium]
MQFQKSLQVTKIMRHENDAWIFWNIALCIFVLVECDELAIIVKLLGWLWNARRRQKCNRHKFYRQRSSN